MSLYNEYANKPWMRPTMYTSEVDSSHQQNATGVSRTTELVNGVPEVIEGRDHYQPTEFGDGRPTGTTDRTPMVYRGPDPGAVIDIDDHDEIDTAPPQYVPIAPSGPPTQEELSRDMPTPKPVPRQPHPAHGNAPHKIGFNLLGVEPSHSGTGGLVAHIGSTAPIFAASADELDQAAATFQAWATMLRAIQR